MIGGRTVCSVMLDNTLYDKGLSNISGTHPIITELVAPLLRSDLIEGFKSNPGCSDTTNM